MTRLDEDIKKYLPQYLSDAEMGRLKKELEQFPTDGTKDTIYTNALADADYLLQGDCIGDMDYLAFPDMRRGKGEGHVRKENVHIEQFRFLLVSVQDFCPFYSYPREN